MTATANPASSASGVAAIIDQLASEAAIRAAVHRYCRGVDRADAELTRSAYHPDATDDHGGFKGSASEFADHVNAAHAGRWTSTTHVIGNHLAHVNGDMADAETYVVAYLRRHDGVTVDSVGGRYVDRFERRAGNWRIARRVYVWEWSAVLDGRGCLVDGAAYAQGRRDRKDLSYAELPTPTEGETQ